VTQHGGVTTSAEGETTPERGMGGDDRGGESLGRKIKKIYVVDSTDINK
jgi:hypothetical protein